MVSTSIRTQKIVTYTTTKLKIFNIKQFMMPENYACFWHCMYELQIKISNIYFLLNIIIFNKSSQRTDNGANVWILTARSSNSWGSDGLGTDC